MNLSFSAVCLVLFIEICVPNVNAKNIKITNVGDNLKYKDLTELGKPIFKSMKDSGVIILDTYYCVRDSN